MTSTTIYGTSHFVTKLAAIKYYSDYGFSRSDVLTKISNGEISIGAPNLKEGERLSIIKGEGRYQIEVTK